MMKGEVGRSHKILALSSASFSDHGLKKKSIGKMKNATPEKCLTFAQQFLHI